MTVQVIHKNSSVQNRPILETQLANGELGINYHESGPFVQLKDTDGEVIRVGGVVQQETQPGLGQKGAWWFKPSTKILYLHNGTTWAAIGGATGGGGGGDVTNTSELINDGQDGVNPYITAQDLTAPGDGELTIRQGGVSKGIFKANQSGDAIIDLDGGGVTKLVAGTNVTISPTSGVGDVTINASGGSGSIDLGYTAASNKGTITNTSGTDAEIPIVDASNAGLMTPSQKTKLDDAAETGDIGNATLTLTQGGVSKGTFTANASANVTIDLAAGGSGSTDLSYTAAADKGTVNCSTGTNAEISVVDGTNAGLMTSAQKATLEAALPKGDINPVLYATLGDLPAAADNHGGVAHVHETGLEYYAHAGSWIALAKASDVPAAQVQSDWTEADSAAVSYIQNKPTIPTVYWQQAAGVLSPITASDVINVAGYRIDQLTAITSTSP